jgi:hypothetical protein
MIFKCVFGNYELRHEWLEGVHTGCFWNTQRPLWCVLWTERMKQVCKCASFDICCWIVAHWKEKYCVSAWSYLPCTGPTTRASHNMLKRELLSMQCDVTVFLCKFILWHTFVEMADMHIMFSCAYWNEFAAQDLYQYTLLVSDFQTDIL